MNFIKQKIKPKIIGIIDIGTYKVRVAITKYKNKDLELIGYGEKRQNCSIEDYNNIEALSENINDGIKKAEKDGNIKIEEVIINIPFSELFFEPCKINYIRKKTDKKIDNEELNEIISEIKKISLKKAFNNIKSNNSYEKDSLKLIISNISKILIDKIETKKLLNKNPKEINISILNIFIPRTKYQLIQSIGRSIDKKIIKIIPTEYSLAKLSYNKDNFVIIDLGSSHTSVIVKQRNKIIGVKKVAIGIQDLIKEISSNHKKTKIDIINSIDEELYLDEKKSFLKIFKDVIVITLEEIVGKDICPHNFFMIGGGSNKFIKNYLQTIDFNKLNIKMAKKINYITPNIDYLGDINSSKSNLNIYSIMKCSQEFIKREKDPIEDSLRKIMSEF